MKSAKSTNKELVEQLIARNQEGRYDQLIANAQANRYHEFKNPDDVACGKMQFIIDTEPFAQELADLRQAIINGDYDESADEQDIKMMRDELLADGSPDVFFSQLGFAVPTPQERAYYAARKNFHKN